MGPLNEVFRAIADPTRREILRLLRRGDMTAGEIAGHFAISKPSISHHLGVLKQAGLVLDVRRGQNIVYSLNTTVFQDVLTWLVQFTERGGGSGDGDAAPV
ncbi:autorepressor SdpR family transcription factor [Caldinitratiruptor microaerophilus]|uniref:Transcriptional regulator n=1 Tax=Caldinitratiruptor microaerophilus TaxID=671077 RepID=A0AA35CHC8_9FIRM|nr:autorepressor SdpR family transcription factor [Caldinitratiruptor microaerophilus]BDG58965.1 transcriptional regulator [Caldinitratiruptor microaerophilus]